MWTEFESVMRQRRPDGERGEGPGPRGRGRGQRGGGHGPGFGGPFGGPPPWVAQMFGPGMGWSGQGGRGGRGPRVRRGDVRTAILDVLNTDAMNGYQVIQQIAEKSGGAWKPSPGSVYPTIAQLEDEGLIESADEAGKKALRLTDEGRSYVSEHPDEMAAVWAPFAETHDDGDHANIKPIIGQLMGAIWQIAVNGTPAQQDQAAEILSDARRRLYGVLADGPGEEETEAADSPTEE
jgi:DNA-binding PadR family transcriptional regulator